MAGVVCRVLKRSFDVLFVSLFSPLWVPLLFVVAVMVRLRLGSPLFFVQVRPGFRGRPFKMIKFRTMTDSRDAQGTLRPDAERMTVFGRWLRSTSLDELPELWHVLKGDMSLVGPRPLLLEYLPLYSEEQRRRHCARPGITGWAQVNGRNAIGWPDKLRLDVWYVDHQSLCLDLRILWLTLVRVFQRHGISADGQATMAKFTGDLR